MIQFFKKTNVDFLGAKRIAIGASLTFILIGIISIFIHKGFNLSVDFAGGTLVQVKFHDPVHKDLGKIRTVISGLGFGSAEVKTIGQTTNNELAITVRKKGEGNVVAEEIRKALEKGYSENQFEVRRVETVGPKIGGELSRDAVIAAFLSLIAILVYVGFRFQIPFGVAAVIPLAHDVLVTVSVFSLLNLEVSISFIAALLTIVGYSINDTIVIFDRIRENMRGGLKGKTFEQLVNGSINQTLSRTIITSLTTIFVVAALWLLGSDAIKDFAFALLIGITVGTYSTIYIASPILLYWHSKKPLIK